MSQELGYSSLSDLITLNSASADMGGVSCFCNGSESCDVVNGNHYGTIVIGGDWFCCGAVTSSSGKKC